MINPMKFVKNLLPQDTRILELCSAFSLIALAIYSGFGGRMQDPPLSNMHPNILWTIMFAFMGLTQLKGLLWYPREELVRVIMSWTTGSFWIFYVVSNKIYSPSDVIALFMGLELLIAFLINITVLSETWRK